MQPVAALDWITGEMLRSLEGETPATPQALSFLLRRYAATGRADLGDALGPSLAAALDRAGHAPGPSPDDPPAEWLLLFVDAAALSEDERLRRAADALVAIIARGWPSRGDVAAALRSVDACLAAAQVADVHADAAAAIDELERIIGLAYTPGYGLARATSRPDGEAGQLIDHAWAASALLTAYAVAGRLPYSMLAEELMQFARRSWWDDARGRFRSSSGEFVGNCEAARVLCRLAALHRDDQYRRAAVTAPDADYAEDARRALESLADEYRGAGTDAAIYGLALTEHQTLC